MPRHLDPWSHFCMLDARMQVETQAAQIQNTYMSVCITCIQHVYMYTHTLTHIHVHGCTCICAHAHVHACTLWAVFLTEMVQSRNNIIRACMFVQHVLACTHVYVCAYKNSMLFHIQVYTCTSTNVHACTT